MNMDEFSFLWTTGKDAYVLVDTEQTVLSISDEDIYQAVIQKMLAEGNKIYDDILDAYADVPKKETE